MSLQSNDLRNLLSTKVHIDQYQSKMGDDDDVVVVSFKVKYRDPATELTNFIEKGYEWVLDADTSSGEMEDGSYLVFIEMLRRPTTPGHLMRIIKDLEDITGNKASTYTFAYHKNHDYLPMTEENMTKIIPLSPIKYRKIHGVTDPVEAQLEPEEKQIDPSVIENFIAESSAIQIKPVSVSDHYKGETFGTKYLYVDNVIKAGVDVSLYGDEVYISHIITADDSQRKGYARMLVNALFKEFPNKKIIVSNMTDDGSAFFRSQFNVNDETGEITPKMNENVPILLKNMENLKEVQAQSKRDLDRMIMAAGLAPKTKPITDPELKRFVNWSKW